MLIESFYNRTAQEAANEYREKVLEHLFRKKEDEFIKDLSRKLLEIEDRRKKNAD